METKGADEKNLESLAEGIPPRLRMLVSEQIKSCRNEVATDAALAEYGSVTDLLRAKIRQIVDETEDPMYVEQYKQSEKSIDAIIGTLTDGSNFEPIPELQKRLQSVDSSIERLSGLLE